MLLKIMLKLDPSLRVSSQIHGRLYRLRFHAFRYELLGSAVNHKLVLPSRSIRKIPSTVCNGVDRFHSRGCTCEDGDGSCRSNRSISFRAVEKQSITVLVCATL